jgi:hypothetical protein
MNNPLHILNNNFFKYAGEVDSDNEFKSFDNLTNGYRAGFYILKYYRRIGYNSIENIINNMLPDNKYNEIYIKFISDNLKINKDDIIRDNKEHINIIYQLSYLLNNEYEKDIDAILKAFAKVYNHIPTKELLKENNINFEKFIPVDIIFPKVSNDDKADIKDKVIDEVKPIDKVKSYTKKDKSTRKLKK